MVGDTLNLNVSQEFLDTDNLRNFSWTSANDMASVETTTNL